MAGVEKRTPWIRLIRLLKLDKKDILHIFYYAIFDGLVALSLPLGVQAIINLIQGAQVTSSWFLLVILVTLGVGFQGVLQIMQKRILENMQQKIFIRSSFEFVYRFPKISIEELRNYYPPELANRFFDTLTIQKSLSKILIDFPAAVLQIVFGLLLLSFYHSFFIFFGVLLIVLIVVVFKYTARRGLETSLKESKAKYKVAHWIQEIARSLLSFKIAEYSELAMQKNDTYTQEYLDAREAHFKILMQQFMKLVGFKILVTASLLIIGGLLVLNQQMNIGQFVAAEIIILLVINSVTKVIMGLESYYDVLTSIEKIGHVVDMKLDFKATGSLPFRKENQSLVLELDELTYACFGKNIVDSLTLKITQGDRILIKGSTGAGRSTLLKLISGVLVPTSGTLYVNETPMSSLNLSEYHNHIGMMFPGQSPFEGTILNNITLGEQIPEEQVYWALKSTGLLSYIKRQPYGLQTMIQSEGLHIPYTISNRILLARAIVKKPKILLLKDPVDLFEPDEARQIIKFLCDKKHPWALVSASRSSLWDTYCNKTLTLHQGKLVD